MNDNRRVEALTQRLQAIRDRHQVQLHALGALRSSTSTPLQQRSPLANVPTLRAWLERQPSPPSPPPPPAPPPLPPPLPPLVLAAGEHVFPNGHIVEMGRAVQLQAGATILLGPNASFIVRGDLHASGTAEAPVQVRALDPARPFATFAVLRRGEGSVRLEHFQLRRGFGGAFDGRMMTGALAIHYAAHVELTNAQVSDNAGEDGLNVKGGDVVLRDSVFEGNQNDQVDLDFVRGVVVRCRFGGEGRIALNGDGLDVSGSRVVVDDSTFQGLQDKGISVGERSTVLARDVSFANDAIGFAVKDGSLAMMASARYRDNKVDTAAYVKKPIFGASRVLLGAQAATTSTKIDAPCELQQVSDFNVDAVPWDSLSQAQDVLDATQTKLTAKP